MRRIILSGVHGVGKSTIAKAITKSLTSQGFLTRLYCLDNFTIYNNEDTLSSQIDRIYFGSMKIKEAEEEQPEIAIFDRSLTDNILYSKCFLRAEQLTESQFNNILHTYQLCETRKFRADATILFLNPPLEQMQSQIHERAREKDTVLDSDDFIECLKKMFEAHYKNYVDSRVIELTEYDQDSIIETLKQLDVIQNNYE